MERLPFALLGFYAAGTVCRDTGVGAGAAAPATSPLSESLVERHLHFILNK